MARIIDVLCSVIIDASLMLALQIERSKRVENIFKFIEADSDESLCTFRAGAFF